MFYSKICESDIGSGCSQKYSNAIFIVSRYLGPLGIFKFLIVLIDKKFNYLI